MKTVTPPSKSKDKNTTAGSGWLDRFAGRIEGLPDDMSANHDFYLHGAHKQQPRRGRWIPAGTAARRPTQAQVDKFNGRMQELAAELEGLPPDLSENLGHYLHGHDKA